MAVKRAAPKRPAEQPIAQPIRDAIRDQVAEGSTFYAVAKLAGVDPSGVYRFLSREKSISLEVAERLAVALGLHLVRKGRPRKPTTAPVEVEAVEEQSVGPALEGGHLTPPLLETPGAPGDGDWR